MQDYYKPVESLLFNDFKMESLPWSKLFKADNSKILDCINGLKSQFFKQKDFLRKFRGGNIIIIK